MFGPTIAFFGNNCSPVVPQKTFGFFRIYRLFLTWTFMRDFEP